jgi:thiosulfate dehydrogenase
MRPQRKLIAVLLVSALAGGAAVCFDMRDHSARAYAQALPTHQLPPAKDGGVVVQLCDGVTSTEVKGLRPGQAMTRQQAVAVTSKLMEDWRRKHPGKRWEIAQADTGGAAPQPPAKASEAAGGSSNIAGPGAANAGNPTSQQGDSYASFHERDLKIWQAETDAFVAEGNKIFHSVKLLGGTIGVSCDMCHPNAANTHPETYPKYQEQLQRVALVRDMINWCIENPVKGKTLSPDDPKMRALEAYIIAQRKGIPMDYGKH